MRCAEFERELQEAMDTRCDLANPESLSEGLVRHAARCASCEASLAGYRSMLVGIGLLVEPASNSEFANRVLAAGTSAHHSRWHRLFDWQTAAMAATAAVLLISVSMAAIGWKASSESVATPTAIDRPTLPATPSVATQFAPPVVVAKSLRDGDMSGIDPSTFAIVWESDFTERPAWMISQLADGLKPVTNSMTGTLNLFLEAWPTSEQPAESEPDRGARNDRYDWQNRIG